MTPTLPEDRPGPEDEPPGAAEGDARAGASASTRWFAALAASVAGTALQLMQGGLWPAQAYAALGLLALALAWPLRRPRLNAGLGLLLAACAGACAGVAQTGWRAVAFQAQALSPALEGRDLRVTGVVAQMPQRGDTGVRFQLAVEQADGAGPGKPGAGRPAVPPRLALSWYAEGGGAWGRGPGPAPGDPVAALPALHAGERWQFTVRLKAPHGHRNPHGFDYELWLWEQGVQATGYVRTGARDAPPVRLAGTWRHPVEQAREAVRDAILARAGAAPADEAHSRAMGVVAALVTGDQAAIERADWDVFRATGVAHLMSISGLHITLFAWLAAGAVGVLWRRSARLVLWQPAPQAALIGGVLLATAYALFSGWGVPAQRTVGMLAIAALLRGGARQWPWPCVWLLVCAAVVAWDPWALLQPGFWLSFVAVGVLFASDAGLAGRLHDVRPRAAQRLAGQTLRLLREQWVVTVALTPLSLLLFHQVSLVGFVANLVAIPWVTLVVTPLAMLGVLVPPLWDVAAAAVRALGIGLGWLAGWPLATWSVAAAPLWAGVAGVLGGLLLAMRLPPPLRLMGLPLLLPVLLWQAPRPAVGEFDLLAADVGQGNAVLLRTAHHSLLYDTGPRYSLESDAGHRVLVPLLRALGERPHTVVLSHRDSDHTGGAAAVLAMQPQAGVLASIEPAHPLQALRPATRCEAGQRWRWDGVQFEMLHPQADDYARFAVRPNALSCVLRVSNGRAAVLLPGDIERAQEAALTARSRESGQTLRADLLLVPHHGSKTSSSEALLEAVAPRLALVQSGWRNRFGHPAPEVTARLRERGIAVVDSPHCGAARWHSRQPDQVHCERLQASRYWQHRPPPAPLNGGQSVRHDSESAPAAAGSGPELAKLWPKEMVVQMHKFDEMYERLPYDGAAIRQHYQRYDQWLAKQPQEAMNSRREEAEMIFRRVGITFAVYGAKDEDGSGTERLIPFDLLPRIIPADEWSEMEKGLVQRVNALNRFLHDVYHDQEIVKAGIIPAEQINNNAQFRPEMIGVQVPNGIYSNISGIDIVRAPDSSGKGEYYVLEDNLRVPSGVSYMLENRKMMMRLFPELFAQNRVAPVAHYPDLLLETLRASAPPATAEPTVVVLTPGMYNSAYFEHAFLAQQMGIELVEGQDLFVKDDFVYMRTTRGPRRVDVIYRRVDDDFLDPEVFRPDSTLGCAGLMRAYKAGNVVICNGVGTGVADDKSIYPYVPKMIEFYLGEKPILKNVPTWMCRNKDDLEYVLSHMEELVVKEVHGAGGYGMLIGPAATQAEIDEFREVVRAKPDGYIAQPTLSLSTSPTFVESGIAPRHIDLRPFVLSAKEVMMVPGGLTRVALKDGSLVVNSSQGGGTKDTWILESGKRFSAQSQSQSQNGQSQGGQTQSQSQSPTKSA